MRLILLGAPGAGKGTQAELVARKLNIPTISTGNILREAIKNRTEVGVIAKSFIDNGMLVPDDVVIGIVRDRLSREDCQKGYILDGVPRTIPQAQALLDQGVQIDRVISIEVADEVIARRMSGRRVCPVCGAPYHIVSNPPKIEGICNACGGTLVTRNDDKPETVVERLTVYHERTEALKGFYEKLGKLRLVEGNQPIEDVNRDVMAALGEEI
ncbi:MAG: adenylate kinase [Oscillospiraceae bacterium]|nr:adenylate kinase [Oscillospiraceae bacterium]